MNFLSLINLWLDTNCYSNIYANNKLIRFIKFVSRFCDSVIYFSISIQISYTTPLIYNTNMTPKIFDFERNKVSCTHMLFNCITAPSDEPKLHRSIKVFNSLTLTSRASSTL